MTFIHETPAGPLFDFTAFIDDAYQSQQKYAKAAGVPGPLDEDLSDSDRYAKIIEHFGHWQEEIVEARVWVPRRDWKTGERSFLDSPESRKEFIAELFDTTLFLRAVCAYAGITGEEFTQVAKEKLNYNSKRKDHITNGTEPVVADPSAELRGDCPSSVFYD